MSRFDDCLAFVLRMEGGYSNDPVDPGGATNYGITQRTYSAWLRAGRRPDASVRDIARGDVDRIYHEQYWTPLQDDTFGAPLDLILFDTAVNHGVQRAIKILQDGLALPITGVLDSVTLNSAKLDNAARIGTDVLTARANFYTEIIANAPSQAKYANGWANRLEAVTKESGLGT